MRGLLRWPRAGALRPMIQTRTYAEVRNFFQFFPKCFPDGGPPADLFIVNPRQLRREYRGLQSEHHPDIVIGLAALANKAGPSDDASALINKAYSTLSNPFTRAAYVIELLLPEHLDITQDETSKALIARFQADSHEYSLNYKVLLMTVLEAHEALEMASSEADLEGLSEENSRQIQETEERIQQLLSEKDIPWDSVIIEAIRMKYWVNIANGIKEWEPGKLVHLTH